MRWFAWCLMIVSAFAIGCDKPAETIPSVTPSSSGTTDSDDHGHDHADGEGHDHAEGEDHDHGDEKMEGEGKAEEGSEDSASTSTTETIRFVSDKSVKVPGMMCPYSCWPKVRDALAAQPGVEAVQLAAQPEGTPEGEIKERVVELKLNGDFDLDAAIAALSAISFDAEAIN